MKSSLKHTEVAIIGAGIMGLAMAYTLAKTGKKVTVWERNTRPIGATIRNFGMIWPIGQPSGKMLSIAMRSRAIWEDVLQKSHCWYDTQGSLHLAYNKDEKDVLDEFVGKAAGNGYQCESLTPQKTQEISPICNPHGLLGAMKSHTEMIVDPREVPQKLMTWLSETYDVHFQMGKAVTEMEEGSLVVDHESWQFEEAYVCCGDELETLFPEVFSSSSLTKVKLQMMRTLSQPEIGRIGPAICGGLTLLHYGSFEACTSRKKLLARVQKNTPWFQEWGIHVMVSQNGKGELIIGDSHEYGSVHDPFIREDINQYILKYLKGITRFRHKIEVFERWYGIYTKNPGKPCFIHTPYPGVKVITGLSGAGMTLSFGLAEEISKGTFVGESPISTTISS